MKAGIVTELIVSDQTDLPKDWTVNDVEMYIVPEAIVKILRETETTQGVFAVCEKHEKEVALTDGKFLLLDGLQDPGNLGTIIRTADQLVFTPLCLEKVVLMFTIVKYSALHKALFSTYQL